MNVSLKLKCLFSMLLILMNFTSALAATLTTDSGDKVIVYYFHRTARCSTCLAFEDYAKKAVAQFPAEIADGRLEWRMINLDEPGNDHYVADYQLFDKSLVVVKMHNGEQTRWKNVEDIWEFSDDEPKFIAFVQQLIADYLTQ